MNKTLLKIIESREDLSDFLFHFTKGANAKDTLEKITKDKAIKDIGKRGVICFTEAPLLTLTRMFDIFKAYPSPMYAPYGIAIKKEVLFRLGGRHVIYGSKEEKEFLDDSIKWRFEEYQPSKKDFTWLREWRVPISNIQLDVNNCFIITNDKSELNELVFGLENLIDIEFDGCVSDGQFEGNATGIVERAFKGISIEEIDELNALSKNEINKMISEQNSSDTGEIGLGGFVGP